jgi:hypothetical protein
VNDRPQLSPYGEFSAHFEQRNLLKTNIAPLAFRLHSSFPVLQEMVVIIYALLAALILLVAVVFISSIDSFKTRRQ